MSDISNRRKFTLAVGLALLTLLMIVSFWYLFNKPQKGNQLSAIEQQENRTAATDNSNAKKQGDTESTDTTTETIVVPLDTDNEALASVKSLMETAYFPFAKTEDWDAALQQLESLKIGAEMRADLKSKLAEKYRNYELSKIEEISRRDGNKLALNYIDGELVYGAQKEKISDKWYFNDYPEEAKKFNQFKQKVVALEKSSPIDTGVSEEKVETANVVSDFVSATEPIADDNGEMYFYPSHILKLEAVLLEVLKAPYRQHDFHSVYQKIYDEYEWASSKDAEKLEEFQLMLLKKQIASIEAEISQKANFEALKSERTMMNEENGKFFFYGTNSRGEQGALCQIEAVNEQVFSLLTETNQSIFENKILSIQKKYNDYIAQENATLFIKLTTNISIDELTKKLGAKSLKVFQKKGNNWGVTDTKTIPSGAYKVEVIGSEEASQLCD